MKVYLPKMKEELRKVLVWNISEIENNLNLKNKFNRNCNNTSKYF